MSEKETAMSEQANKVSSRDTIFARIRQAEARRTVITPMPAVRPQPPLSGDPKALLTEKMQAATARVHELSSADEVPEWVTSYLSEHNLAKQLVCGNRSPLAQLNWETHEINLERRKATKEDPVAISQANWAIAETGTVVIPSGPANPTSLNFLPDHHIVVVESGNLVTYWEDAWKRIREAFGEGELPRALNFISGPSSTADVALTPVFGAHGPRHLSVLLIDANP